MVGDGKREVGSVKRRYKEEDMQFVKSLTGQCVWQFYVGIVEIWWQEQMMELWRVVEFVYGSGDGL